MTTERDEMMARIEQKEREEAELLASLTIPADDDRGTYTGRSLTAQRVEKREDNDGQWHAITGSSGWTAGCSPEVYALLPEGKEYVLETRNFSQITGWLIDGVWHDRKTDEELEAERLAFIENNKREREEELEKNRASWQARQDALPDWVRTRLENFHERSEGKFAADGWGYELCVAELAVMYADMGEGILDKDSFTIEDNEAISQYAKDHGTSGNQHGMALALAKAHLEDPERMMNDTVSALSPLTGDAFYEGKD